MRLWLQGLGRIPWPAGGHRTRAATDRAHLAPDPRPGQPLPSARPENLRWSTFRPSGHSLRARSPPAFTYRNRTGPEARGVGKGQGDVPFAESPGSGVADCVLSLREVSGSAGNNFWTQPGTATCEASRAGTSIHFTASGFTNTDNLTTTATVQLTTPGTTSVIPTNLSSEETATPSTFGSTSPYSVSLGSNGTTATISETTVNFTSTSEVPLVAGTTNSSGQSQTSLAITVPTTLANFSTSEMTVKPSVSPGNVSDPSLNHTSLETPTTETYVSPTPTPRTIKGEIKCSGVKEVRLTQGICLELNETSSCEDFKKDKGEGLAQVLCREEQADAEAGARVCSLLLAQSEVKPQCLLLVLANRTEISSKLQLLKKHESDLEKLGIKSVTKQDVASHQSYSRKTLIALVTSGVLLAVLGITGYYLMNRRSWSPAGERLELEP
ncbi:hematopoietic progenitor cell antigen CD34 isoform X2 [Lemur catta]|uniref:hematopoietic progenitor cell antigen CD34 isoform X2 n=1 Tax=Lemur catta TaxID=9447 RepID=UPI001E268AA0|nr:hematopoietic progenitor cell antigen CD34 isoform X2 [Lemur catta]